MSGVTARLRGAAFFGAAVERLAGDCGGAGRDAAFDGARRAGFAADFLRAAVLAADLRGAAWLALRLGAAFFAVFRAAAFPATFFATFFAAVLRREAGRFVFAALRAVLRLGVVLGLIVVSGSSARTRAPERSQ